MWDASVFIWCGKLGHFGSIFTAGALLVNAAMQMLMCVLINDALTPAQMSEENVDNFKYWRTNVAHNKMYVDQLSWKPLALSVCEFGDPPMSSSAIAGLEAISEYLPNTADQAFIQPPPLSRWGNWLGHYAGPIMCCVTLVIWWATVLREVYSIVDMTKAVGLLPKGRTAISRTEQGYKLEAVSTPRRCLMFALVLLRACICVPLLACGTLYLVPTISLGDLILNAAALEIVLHMDELMFSVFAPVSVRRLIQSMEPLPAGRSATCCGLDAKPVLALLFNMVGMVCVITMALNPQIELMERAREALCGGNLYFVAGVDQTGMVHASEYTDIDVTNTYTYLAMRHLIEDEDAADERYFPSGVWMSLNVGAGISGGHWSVETQASRTVEAATFSFNNYCQDADFPGFDSEKPDFWRVAHQILQDSIGGMVSSCEDVVSYCGSQGQSGVRARQYCPETCGCDDPTSSPHYMSTELGCPISCRFSDMYKEKLGDLECADYNVSKRKMINGEDVMSVYSRSKIPVFLRDFESIVSESGCQGIVSTVRETLLGDLCKEANSEGLMPLTLLCPETCRCDLSGELLCPPACGLVEVEVEVEVEGPTLPSSPGAPPM
jgi:hypothetical protein